MASHRIASKYQEPAHIFISYWEFDTSNGIFAVERTNSALSLFFFIVALIEYWKLETTRQQMNGNMATKM